MQNLANRPPPLSTQVILRGDGTHLGCPVTWSLRLGAGGAFREDVSGADMSFSWGHDGRARSPAWEADGRGAAKHLALDDHESLLLAAWVRTGWWAAPGAAGVERVAVATTHDAPPSIELRVRGGRLAAVLDLDPSTWLPTRMTQPLCGGLEEWTYGGWGAWPGARGASFPTHTRHAASAGGGNVFRVRTATSVADDDDACNVAPPSRRRAAGGGGVAVAAAAAAAAAAPAPTPVGAPPLPTHTAAAMPAPPSVPTRRTRKSPYSRPRTSLRAPDASFDVGAAPTIRAWWSSSGHLLVHPTLDGAPSPGLFILDTGASGLVIDPAAADAAGWPSFGELHVSGVAGAVAARFRRGASLSLGPLTLTDPVYMEMPLSGLVTGLPDGAPGPVVGIAGHDVFRAAVVTLPPPPPARAGGNRRRGTDGAAVSVRLDDPITYTPPASGVAWERVVMVANLPHVAARVPLPSSTSASAPALLMLDTGAGGVDVMFHARAAVELGLTPPAPTARALRGVGAGSGAGAPGASVAAAHATLPWLELGGATFGGPVAALVAARGGLDLSLYSAGIACSGLLARTGGAIIDVPRRRVAFLPAPGRVAPASPRDARAPRRGVPRGRDPLV